MGITYLHTVNSALLESMGTERKLEWCRNSAEPTFAQWGQIGKSKRYIHSSKLLSRYATIRDIRSRVTRILTYFKNETQACEKRMNTLANAHIPKTIDHIHDSNFFDHFTIRISRNFTKEIWYIHKSNLCCLYHRAHSNISPVQWPTHKIAAYEIDPVFRLTIRNIRSRITRC